MLELNPNLGADFRDGSFQGQILGVEMSGPGVVGRR